VESVENLKSDVTELKETIGSLEEKIDVLMQHHHQRTGAKSFFAMVIGLLGFLVGNVLQWYIFRGPGHS